VPNRPERGPCPPGISLRIRFGPPNTQNKPEHPCTFPQFLSINRKRPNPRSRRRGRCPRPPPVAEEWSQRRVCQTDPARGSVRLIESLGWGWVCGLGLDHQTFPESHTLTCMLSFLISVYLSGDTKPSTKTPEPVPHPPLAPLQRSGPSGWPRPSRT